MKLVVSRCRRSANLSLSQCTVFLYFLVRYVPGLLTSIARNLWVTDPMKYTFLEALHNSSGAECVLFYFILFF